MLVGVGIRVEVGARVTVATGGNLFFGIVGYLLGTGRSVGVGVEVGTRVGTRVGVRGIRVGV